MRVGLLTVSDRVARGDREDLSGQALAAMVESRGWVVAEAAVVPDEAGLISERLREWADVGLVDLVLTTGGTGFSARDVTPEATLSVVERLAPGLAEAMRTVGLRTTPHSMLSRAVAGIRGMVLIVNLPGSPKGAVENLEVILPALPHAVEILRGEPGAEQRHVLPPKPTAA